MANSSHNFRFLRMSQPFLSSTSFIDAVFSIFSEDLIEDIETDKRVALNSLSRPAYQKFMHDNYFEISPIPDIPTQIEK